MFNLFGKKNKDTEPSSSGEPEWIAIMNDNRSRWFAFVEKLQVRMNELGEASIPELQESFTNDTDTYKRQYHLMSSGIKGQFAQILDKARTVYEEKVNGFFYEVNNSIPSIATNVGREYHNTIYEYREACNKQMDSLEKLYHSWNGKINATGVTDYEAEYEKILDEYEAKKNEYHCSKCGAQLTIDKIFFTSTYITCGFCQSQNTFEPSSQARALEHIGRSLAEQRTQYLLDVYAQEKAKADELYNKMHKLKLSIIHEKNAAVKSNVEQQIIELGKERQRAINDAPDKYRTYLRAMFDEWNKIVPDLKEHNEKFYLRMLQDFNKYG